MRVTDKDQELIALLQTNARMPVSELARRLRVSRTTIQDRLRRLEISGVIAGYGVRLADQATTEGILVHVELSVEPRMTAEVVRALMRMPQVQTLHTVSGKFDLIAQIRALTTDHIDKVLDQIGVIEGITRTESAIILSTKLDRR
ncbi:MAG: Lrp/AsnC family transcriptional regulator [Anderseniella sp.]